MQVYINKGVRYDFGQYDEDVNTFTISRGDLSRNPNHLSSMASLVEDLKAAYPSTEWKDDSHVGLMSLLPYYAMESITEVWNKLPGFYQPAFAQILLGALISSSRNLAVELIEAMEEARFTHLNMSVGVDAPAIIVLQILMDYRENKDNHNHESLGVGFYHNKRTYGYVYNNRRITVLEVDLLASPRLAVFSHDNTLAEFQAIASKHPHQYAEPDDVDGVGYNVIKPNGESVLAIGRSQLKGVLSSPGFKAIGITF